MFLDLFISDLVSLNAYCQKKLSNIIDMYSYSDISLLYPVLNPVLYFRYCLKLQGVEV